MDYVAPCPKDAHLVRVDYMIRDLTVVLTHALWPSFLTAAWMR
jgi:hypothetical protein